MKHLRGCPLFTHLSQRPAEKRVDCICPTLRRPVDPATQAGRILAYIRANPGCTTMDLSLGLDPFVANVRGRISDLRAMGYDVRCNKRAVDHRDGYWLIEAPEQMTAGLDAA